MSTAFWQGKKVFVTGHTGFKGAWLTAALTQMGADVTGYALKPPTEPSLFDMLNLRDRIRHVEADIRDRHALTNALQEVQPEIVLHLAAQALVRKSYADPVTTFEANTMGTVNLLDALRHLPSCRSAVVITSDKCYANDDNGKNFDENDKMGGKDPYSASKGAAELVAYAYDQSYFEKANFPMATARAGNVIGGGDWAEDRLIPDAMRAAQKGEAVLIRSPSATRPWQHVLEPVFAYLELAEKLYTHGRIFAGGWNFGPYPQDIQPVSVVLDILQKTVGFTLELDKGPHPVEAKTLGLSIAKAQKHMQWFPRLTLDDAVTWTGAWYRAFFDGQDMRAFTLKQIAEFLERPAISHPAPDKKQAA